MENCSTPRMLLVIFLAATFCCSLAGESLDDVNALIKEIGSDTAIYDVIAKFEKNLAEIVL